MKNKRNLNTKCLLLQNDQNADTTLLHSHDEMLSSIFVFILQFIFCRKPSKSKSKSTKSSTKSKSSSKPITSLEDDWNDDGGWDDAAWEAVEQEVKTKKGDWP